MIIMLVDDGGGVLWLMDMTHKKHKHSICVYTGKIGY